MIVVLNRIIWCGLIILSVLGIISGLYFSDISTKKKIVLITLMVIDAVVCAVCIYMGYFR